VAKGELLATIETDKVSVEVKAEEGGILKELLAELDSTVEAGKVIARIEVGDVAAATLATPGPAVEAANVAPPMADATHLQGLRAAFAKLAAQRSGLSWPPSSATTVEAAGSHVSAPAAAAPLPARPAAGTDEGPTERRVPLSAVRQRVMQRLKDAQNTAALLTTFQEADMSAALALQSKYRDLFQKKHGAPLGLLSLFAKASANALAEVPAINAVIDDATNETVFRDYVDLSIPIPSPRGPVACVLQNVESMSVKDIELKIQDLVKKAAKDQLSVEDMAGPTFGINDTGVAGSMLSTSIVNPPQSAVMGTNAITQRAIAVDGKATARPVMYLSLTYDHRLIDGREAVTFLCSVRDKMQDPARLLIDL
jgi:2-oxoglutarate dehydrogenase E2 component (dihydrolipoamide succinyltransferase)